MTTKVRKSVSALHAHDLGSLTKEEILRLVDNQIPRGICTVWSGDEADIPAGWEKCTGFGGRTPNLANRTVIGAGASFPLNSTGGKYNFDLNIQGRTDGHVLQPNECPPHTHTYETHALGDTARTGWSSHRAASKYTSMYETNKVFGNAEGNADPHDHGFSARFKHEAIGPYIVKHWIMRTGDIDIEESPSSFQTTGRTRVTSRLADLSLKDLDMLSKAEIIRLVTAVFPSGICMPWWGDINNIPDGWDLLDGTKGNDDFRDRMVIGAGGNYPLHSTGGSIDVRFVQNAEVTHTELGVNHFIRHYHDYECKRLYQKARQEVHKPWPAKNHEDSAQFNRRTYNTGNAKTKGVAWGNKFGGVDPHTHPYTITYVHKAMTPFYALWWLKKR